MNCGLYCMHEYVKDYGIRLDVVWYKEYMSMLEMKELFERYGVYANGYYSSKICKQAPYILYLPKQKHFMLVKKVGWFVTLCDQRVGEIRIPYVLYWLIYQGYYLKIEHICFRQE